MDNAPTHQKPAKSPPAITQSPIWKLTPGNNSSKMSNLYDSYELQAVSKQINRAIRGSKSPLSPYSYYMNLTPYRSRQSSCLTTKRICYPQLESKTHNPQLNCKGNRGILSRIWRRIKARLANSKWYKYFHPVDKIPVDHVYNEVQLSSYYTVCCWKVFLHYH